MPKNYTYPTQNLCVYVKKLVNGESKGMKCIHNATDKKKKKKINNIRLKRTTEKTDRKKTKKNNRQYTNSTQNTLTIGLDEIPSHHIETICLKTNAQRHRKFNKREEEKEEVEEAATTKKNEHLIKLAGDVLMVRVNSPQILFIEIRILTFVPSLRIYTTTCIQMTHIHTHLSQHHNGNQSNECE